MAVLPAVKLSLRHMPHSQKLAAPFQYKGASAHWLFCWNGSCRTNGLLHYRSKRWRHVDTTKGGLWIRDKWNGRDLEFYFTRIGGDGLNKPPDHLVFLERFFLIPLFTLDFMVLHSYKAIRRQYAKGSIHLSCTFLLSLSDRISTMNIERHPEYADAHESWSAREWMSQITRINFFLLWVRDCRDEKSELNRAKLSSQFLEFWLSKFNFCRSWLYPCRKFPLRHEVFSNGVNCLSLEIERFP